MSWFAKFGIAIFASVVLGLVTFCAGLALSLTALSVVLLGLVALPIVACIVLLVANEVYEVRNDIPFQW